MKVLWFSNSKANADEYFNTQLKGTGGWLKSLDAELQDKVDLYIVYHSGNEKLTPFKHKQTTYYPIQNYKNKIDKYLSLLSVKVFDEEFKSEYLRIINEVEPDVIHIHGTENPFGCIIDIINIPVIISIQGNLTIYSYKYYSSIGKEYLNISERRKVFFRSSFKSGYDRQVKMAKVEQKNLLKCQHIIGRTRWDKRITRVLAPDSDYHHVDEILRDEFYDKIWQKKNKSKFVIFTTNANNFYKGFETISEAVYLLNKIGLNIEWRVAGIDKGDLIVKVVKKKLKKKFPKSGLKLLGRISATELVESLLDSNVYVMSSHIENSPNNLCEAMILGMPCIATNAGGTASMLNDGEDGILIQDGDPWVMSGAVVELMENEELAIQYGKKAREKALKRHNKKTIVENLINVYSMISSPKQSFKNRKYNY